MSRQVKYVTCAICGHTDRPVRPQSALHPGGHAIEHNVGTSVFMQCPDCAGDDKRATMCRVCCPTGHGTRFPRTAKERKAWEKRK